jgi:hypothetical protein
MILNYLATRNDLDMDRIGMFGQGSGATIAILASAADPRIKAIDLLTPWADWPNWLAKSKVVPEDERAKYLTPEFLASVAPLDPTLWLPKVKAKSVRIRDVRRHFTVPDVSEEHLEAAAPAFAEIDQFGDGRAFYEAGTNFFGWIKDHLPINGQPPVVDQAQRVHIYPAKEESIH